MNLNDSNLAQIELGTNLKWALKVLLDLTTSGNCAVSWSWSLASPTQDPEIDFGGQLGGNQLRNKLFALYSSQ